VIRYNVVHSITPYFLYGHGIYLDEGASGITIASNWVYDTYAALFILHYGVNNTVSNNVFMRANGACISYHTLTDGTYQLPYPH
jgi:hypothetical protein